jgi:hypothetical protein
MKKTAHDLGALIAKSNTVIENRGIEGYSEVEKISMTYQGE